MWACVLTWPGIFTVPEISGVIWWNSWCTVSGKGCITSFGSGLSGTTTFASLRPSPTPLETLKLCVIPTNLPPVLDHTILIHTVSRVIFIHLHYIVVWTPKTTGSLPHARQNTPLLLQTLKQKSTDLATTNVHGDVFIFKGQFLSDHVWTVVDMKIGRICLFDVQLEVRAKRV